MTDAQIGLNAHLLSGQAGYRRAGIHGYLYNTLAHLAAVDPGLRYKVFVGEGAPVPGVPPPHERLNVCRSRLKTERPARRILWEQTALPFQLGGLDLLHGMAFVTPLLVPLLARLPTVVTVYDLSFLHYPERLPAARRLYLRTLTRISCRRARRVIAISASTAADVAEHLGVPRERIDVALPGVGAHFRPPTAEAVADFRARQGLPERFLLHVGTLEPRKNLPVLLKAYARLPESTQRDVPLVLVGGQGWGQDDIRATIDRLSLAGAVLLPGYAPDDELPLWYGAATAFVYPSVYEGWGMPVVEALACGTPVVTSNVSSLPEAAGEAGLTLPPHDVDAWTDGLHTALADATWRETVQAQGITQAATFTWDKTARAHVAAYRAALA